jgi:BASS family bile acid:Na+ symporter
MKKNSPVFNIYTIALGLAASCALTVGGLLFVGNPTEIGPFLIGFFVMLAIGCRGGGVRKSQSYRIIIFAAVSIALYYFLWG